MREGIRQNLCSHFKMFVFCNVKEGRGSAASAATRYCLSPEFLVHAVALLDSVFRRQCLYIFFILVVPPTLVSSFATVIV